MITHQHTPPQRSRYNMGYRTCPSCDFQFTPESDDQTTCTLCQTAAVFRARADGVAPDTRKITCPSCGTSFTRKESRRTHCTDCRPPRMRNVPPAWKQQRNCDICHRPYWPNHPNNKYCYQDACKREAQRRYDAKRESHGPRARRAA